MAANRGIELIFESTPQTFFQTFRVIRSTAEHEIISSVQYATLIISFLAIGFIFTIMDYEIDTSEHHRKTESKIFGYIPSSKGKRVIFTLMLMIHVSSYSAMRTIAGSALVYANPTLFAIWAAVLFAAFTGIKVFRRTYNTFKPAPGFFSHVIHVITFFSVTVGGCLSMRIPYMVTGRLYTSFLLYGYIDAFAMLVASRYASSGSSDLSYDAFKSVMIMVGASACTSATLLWLIKTRLMVQSFNWMWWSTRTPREQFSIWIWENNVYSQFGPDLNDHRARAISEGFRNEYYIHDLRVKEWLHSNWSEWEKDPLPGLTMFSLRPFRTSGFQFTRARSVKVDL